MTNDDSHRKNPSAPTSHAPPSGPFSRPPSSPPSYAPSSEPFYSSIPAAPISSSSYSQAPRVGTGTFGDEHSSDPYSQMGYSALPGSGTDRSTRQPAQLDHQRHYGTSEQYEGGQASVEDLYRAPGNPYSDHSGRAISATSPNAYASPGQGFSPATQSTRSTSFNPGAVPAGVIPPGDPGGAPAPAKKKRGAGCAISSIAFLIVAGFIIAGAYGFISDFIDTPASPSSSSSALPTVPDTELEEGMCFQSLEPEQSNELQPVPCDEPHRFEVAANIEIPGSNYPGEDEVRERASRECRETAEDTAYIFNTSELTPYSLYPSEGTWAGGDRTISCFIATEGDELLHGSAHEGDLEVK